MESILMAQAASQNTSVPVEAVGRDRQRLSRIFAWANNRPGRTKSLSACLANCELKHCETGRVAIDCTDVFTVRSEELNHLIRLHLKARDAGVDIALLNVSEPVANVLKVTRLDRLVSTRVDQQHEAPPTMRCRPK